MAGVTYIGGTWVRSRFAGGDGVVMATGTGTDNLRMIHRTCCYRRPAGREHGMTGIAKVSGVNVAREFTRGRYAVMAGYTISGEITMVHCRHRQPRRSGMAGIALQRGLNMRRRFAGGNHIVMTTGTDADDFLMINPERRRRKRRWPRCVTGIAHIGGVDVRCRLANGGDIVVATGTGTNDLRMVHIGRGNRRPLRGEFLVAGIAQRGRCNMR